MQEIMIDGKLILCQNQLVSDPEGSFLFVHGSGGDHHKWDALMKQLPPQFSAVSVDLPGHAGSAGPLLQNIAEGADWLSKLIDRLALPRPLWLTGHSMGSALAISTALEDPGQIDGLILIGAGSRLRVMPHVLAMLQEGKTDTSFICAGFSPAAPDALLEKEIETFRQIPAEVLFADFTACDQFDRSEDVKRINLPTLVIVGEEDQLTPMKYARFLHEQISGSELVIVPQAGHMVMLEKPVKVAQAITAFVNRK